MIITFVYLMSRDIIFVKNEVGWTLGWVGCNKIAICGEELEDLILYMCIILCALQNKIKIMRMPMTQLEHVHQEIRACCHMHVRVH